MGIQTLQWNKPCYYAFSSKLIHDSGIESRMDQINENIYTYVLGQLGDPSFFLLEVLWYKNGSIPGMYIMYPLLSITNQGYVTWYQKNGDQKAVLLEINNVSNVHGKTPYLLHNFGLGTTPNGGGGVKTPPPPPPPPGFDIGGDDPEISFSLFDETELSFVSSNHYFNKSNFSINNEGVMRRTD
jgi:hypothetical protein